MFPRGGEQARAIGIYSFVAAAGGAIGLLAGGVLTQAISWHWIFFVNVPIALVTAFLVARLLESDPGIGLHNGADVPGAVLITGALMLGVYAIVEASRYGWGSTHTLVFGGIALLLLVGFVIRQATASQPLMTLRVLRVPNVAAANVIQVLMVAGIFGMFFLGALYLQQVLHYDAIEVGLAFLPVAVAIGLFSVRWSAMLAARYGARRALIGGLLLIVAGLVLFARAPVGATYVPDLLPVMLLLGIGAGICFPTLMTLAMSGATPEDSGLASGLVNTTQQVGGALGLAVLASLSATHTSHLLAGGDGTPAALTSGYHLAFVIGAVLVGVAVVVAATALRPVEAVGAEAVEEGVVEVWGEAEAA
jgi:MFS family permease